MIRVCEKEFEELKEKEQIVEEIKEQTTIRERINFITSHIMIGAVVLGAFISKLF